MDSETEVILQAINDTAEDIWKEFDADESGFLEREEFKNFCLKMSDALNLKKITEEVIDEMIIKFEGESGDKKISKDEMKRYLKDLYGIKDETE
ncbi:unnamed protein product [Moneuplotes crassus]|uniref:EF-hand domain-containing protein n=1 Tax=Euplotes crassus TaxID=5936 RepID=A0AAD2D864_EUPCR|nr:unnamed protein product [Moneuplotes crassus]|mmetsp:Transcript_12643/g.12686  ORF Transcript_12643/g.12686 Transcript_12643/m.12686 type:complete len:94 (+) Transcript_12643:2-283(+)